MGVWISCLFAQGFIVLRVYHMILPISNSVVVNLSFSSPFVLVPGTFSKSIVKEVFSKKQKGGRMRVFIVIVLSCYDRVLALPQECFRFLGRSVGVYFAGTFLIPELRCVLDWLFLLLDFLMYLHRDFLHSSAASLPQEFSCSCRYLICLQRGFF